LFHELRSPKAAYRTVANKTGQEEEEEKEKKRKLRIYKKLIEDKGHNVT
jgi:hypothetical protein